MNWMPIPMAIALGAVLGALSRYYVTMFWGQITGHQFPYGTLFANVTGAFVIGLVSMTMQATGVSLVVENFVVAGFLGAYTTFSSYILDASNLLKRGHTLASVCYWWGSPLLGLIAVKLGLLFAQLMR